MKNIKRWMEFANDYTKAMNEQFQVMNKFWNASLDQTASFGSKNMETFFDHMNGNVDLLKDMFEKTAKANDELKEVYKHNFETIQSRIQDLYEKSVLSATLDPKPEKNSENKKQPGKAKSAAKKTVAKAKVTAKKNPVKTSAKKSVSKKNVTKATKKSK